MGDVTFTRTRRDINGRLTDYLAEQGIEWHWSEVICGRRLYVINGETLTTGEACDKYLPGGFSANFGRA